MIGEHLFFLLRVETTMGNLRRIRGQELDIISQLVVGSMASIDSEASIAFSRLRMIIQVEDNLFPIKC
jgi:hypothetical protein